MIFGKRYKGWPRLKFAWYPRYLYDIERMVWLEWFYEDFKAAGKDGQLVLFQFWGRPVESLDSWFHFDVVPRALPSRSFWVMSPKPKEELSEYVVCCHKL